MPKIRRTLYRPLDVFLVLATVGGCQQTAKNMGEAAAGEAAPAGLRAINEPANQQMMQDFANSKAMQSLGNRLGQGLLEGAASAASATMPANGNTPSTTQAAMGNVVERPRGWNVSASTQDASREAVLRGEPAPSAVQTAVRMAALEARDVALGPQAQAQAHQWAASVASGSISGTADATRQTLGPAVASALREEIAPAMREVFRQSVQGAMEGAGGQGLGDHPSGADVARSVAKGTALGMQDASREPGQAGETLSLLQTANRAIWVVVTLVALLGILGLANSFGLLLLALTIWRSRPRERP
jgi:hypothetical protein